MYNVLYITPNITHYTEYTAHAKIHRIYTASEIVTVDIY